MNVGFQQDAFQNDAFQVLEIITIFEERIMSRLTSPYSTELNSNNRKLLKIVSDECDEIDTTISDIQDAHFVNAATAKSLEYLGGLFQTIRTTGETDAQYRARLKTMWQRLTGSGTIQDIKNIIMALLSVGGDRIELNEDFSTKYADFDVWVFLQDLDAVGVTSAELSDLLDHIKGAGISLNAYTYGTFECRAAADTPDPTKGYDDIAHSNPTGGTYAGKL